MNLAPFLVLNVALLSETAVASSTSQPPTLGPRRSMDWRPLARLSPGRYAGSVEIKFVDGSDPRVSGGAILNRLGEVMLSLHPEFLGAEARQVQTAFGFPPKQLRALVEVARHACRCQVADLDSYVRLRLDVPEQTLPALMERLNGLKHVEVAYPLQLPVPPPADLPPPTPDFQDAQGYGAAAPDGMGIHLVASQPGGDGTGVSFVDMEVDWTDTHEDLEPCQGRQVPEVGTIYPGLEYRFYRAHGTAVLSLLAAPGNGYGVTGLVPGATCNYAPDYTVEHGDSTARALLAAYHEAVVRRGDVFLMESQAPGPDYVESTGEGLVPSEWEPAVFDAIRTLAAAGVVVVEAAGNGYENLDDPKFGGAFDPDRADSGALMVGAGHPPGLSGSPARSRMVYSNHGRRVDVQSWGANVTAAGYGDLFTGNDDERQFYTGQFAGTSSASALVTAAAVLIQSIQKAGGGELLAPATVRQLLVVSGTPQTGNLDEHIGPLPDLVGAVTATRVCGNARKDALEVCDDGNTAGGDGCSADCRSNETCGNKITDIATGERCDDGNTAAGDGCSSDCRSDETCGNGVVDAHLGEVCDDGNTTPGDHCAADCRSTEQCGNGVVDSAQGETCDDGNLADGDGCSSACTREEDTGGNREGSILPTPPWMGGAPAVPGCVDGHIPRASPPWVALAMAGLLLSRHQRSRHNRRTAPSATEMATR